jgi:hypothetical protein
MNENRTIHLVDIPIGGKGGFVWNRLHGEREDLCEALLKDPEPMSQAAQRRYLLQGRLRRIDDALDRLMSGSYGICSKCRRQIEDATLDVDPAWALCLNCWASEPRVVRRGSKNEAGDDNTCSEFLLQSLNPFDTILLHTIDSEYRILLLDPKTGRALVEGGQYFVEPSEALLMGSAPPGSEIKNGTICVGYRLEIWADEKVFLTSPIKSLAVKHNAPAESAESLAEALR